MQTRHRLRSPLFIFGPASREIRTNYACCGFQLLELLIAMTILSIIALIAVSSYSKYRDKVDIATAMGDIRTTSLALIRFYSDNRGYPDSLTEIGMGDLKDPWGHPYQYLKIAGADPKVKGKVRKDKNLVPVNNDFDLYSMGKDGNSTPAFTAKASQDDIVRANNGKFVGLVADY